MMAGLSSRPAMSVELICEPTKNTRWECAKDALTIGKKKLNQPRHHVMAGREPPWKTKEENMASLEGVGFKYQVGDKLVAAGALGASEKTLKRPKFPWKDDGLPAAFIVLERIAVECSGGVQLQYTCRAHSSAGHVGNPIPIHEHELLPYPEIVEAAE